jgi:hypothetical protein
MQFSPSSQGQRKFGSAFGEIEREGNEGERLRLHASREVIDLTTMNQELALSVRVMGSIANGERPRWNMRLVEPEFTAIDPGVGILDLGSAFSQGFHLTTGEDHPAFEGLKDVVVMACPAI